MKQRLFWGQPGRGSSVTVVPSQGPFSGAGVQHDWSEAGTDVRGSFLITQALQAFPPQRHTQTGFKKPSGVSTEETALSFRSQDFPESVFPACVNSHSYISYLHCSKADHRIWPKECKILRWLSLTSSTPAQLRSHFPQTARLAPLFLNQ